MLAENGQQQKKERSVQKAEPEEELQRGERRFSQFHRSDPLFPERMVDGTEIPQGLLADPDDLGQVE